jgi:hypothetical protein
VAEYKLHRLSDYKTLPATYFLIDVFLVLGRDHGSCGHAQVFEDVLGA